MTFFNRSAGIAGFPAGLEARLYVSQGWLTLRWVVTAVRARGFGARARRTTAGVAVLPEINGGLGAKIHRKEPQRFGKRREAEVAGVA